MASFFLVIVVALLGLTFPLIEMSMQMMDPFLFVSLRFVLAAALLAPFCFGKIPKVVWTSGALLGVLNYGGYLTQTIGLATVNASRAAFLTGTSVVMIPFVASLFKMQPLRKRDIMSALICCLGIYILTGCDTSRISTGDVWILLCALFVAFSISYIGYLANLGCDPYLLTLSQIMATAACSLIPCFLFSDFDLTPLQHLSTLSVLLYCSLFATILALALQTKYQKYVSTTKVGLIFCLEPAFATCFDKIITGRELTYYALCGGATILFGILLSELKTQKQEEQKL